jgi:hypothetical protein
MTVTWSTVRRLFTGLDIGAMREVGYHLDNYEHVVQNFDLLYGRLADRSMPPEPFEKWSDEKLKMLRDWRDGGFPPQAVPSKNGPKNDKYWERVDNFIGLSELLTGFNTLHNDPELGAKYLERMKARGKSKPGSFTVEALHGFIDKYAERDPDDEERTPAEIFEAKRKSIRKFSLDMLQEKNADDYIGVVRTLVVLWYTGTFVNNFGFPDGDNGTPEDNQYIDGLVWAAGKTHPMGYSTEGYVPNPDFKDGDPEQDRYVAHWELAPEDDGQHTGLGNTATYSPTSPSVKR